MTTRAIAPWVPDGKGKREKGEVRHKNDLPNRDLQKSPIDAAKEFYRIRLSLFYNSHRAFELQKKSKAVMPVLALAV